MLVILLSMSVYCALTFLNLGHTFFFKKILTNINIGGLSSDIHRISNRLSASQAGTIFNGFPGRINFGGAYDFASRRYQIIFH